MEAQRTRRIKLEQQNEELIRTRSELEVALARYTDLFQFAPSGYLTLGPTGVIREANRASAVLLEAGRTSLIGRRFLSFVSAGNRRDFSRFLAKLRPGKEAQSILFRLARPDRKPAVAVNAKVMRTSVTNEFRVAMLDVTAQQQTEAALLRSQETLRHLATSLEAGRSSTRAAALSAAAIRIVIRASMIST